MRLPERAPVVEVALNRRATLKPLRRMNGDDLASLMRHTRDNRAEVRRETKSSEEVALTEMNRQLRAQFREHRRFLDGVRRQQDGVYETMLQLAEIKRRLGLPIATASPPAPPRAATVTSVAATAAPPPRPQTVGGSASVASGATGGPLCPLLRRTVEKALGDVGTGGGGCRAGDEGGAVTAATTTGTSGEAVASSSPIREALRRFKAGAFMTATFARPRKLPPIDEMEASTTMQRAAVLAQANERTRGGGAAVQPSGAQGSGGAARPASGGSEAQQPQDRHSRRRAATREDLRRLLDNEPCRVHRLVDGDVGGFESEPDTYKRRTFRALPPEQSREEDEAKRARLADQCRQSRKHQVALAAELFKRLFPEQDNVVERKEDDTPAPTPPPPPRKAFRQGANSVAAASLAECGYLRQYVRPSARPRILSPITSWNQKS